MSLYNTVGVILNLSEFSGYYSSLLCIHRALSSAYAPKFASHVYEGMRSNKFIKKSGQARCSAVQREGKDKSAAVRIFVDFRRCYSLAGELHGNPYNQSARVQDGK